MENYIYIVGILGVFWLIQAGYYLLIMGRVFWKKPSATGNSTPPVSVIICAKNEEDNLKKNLPLILSQDYPNYQVVVVNDCSEDDTELVLAQFKNEYDKLYYTTIPGDKKFFHGKKLALVVGVKAATNELLLLTDADCAPASDKWLASMTTQMVVGKDMVLGYGKYRRTKGLLNMFVRYEALWNAVQYMGHALVVKPFMAVGRNLAYTKTLFNNGSQFRNNLSMASGDDDLFVLEMGTKHNSAVCYDPQSHTECDAPQSLNAWINRKARHLSTATHYPFGTKLLIGLELLSRLGFWILSIYCLIFNIFAPIVLGLLTLRIVFFYLIMVKALKKFDEKGMLFAVLILDVVTPCIQAVAWLNKLLGRKKSKWR